MNTLVVYDSQYGNTERIAQAIADTLGTFGQAQAVHVDPGHQVSFQGVDLLILGSPTQGFRLLPGTTFNQKRWHEPFSFRRSDTAGRVRCSGRSLT